MDWSLGLPFCGNPVVFPHIPCQHSGLKVKEVNTSGLYLRPSCIATLLLLPAGNVRGAHVSGTSKNTPKTLIVAGYYVHIHEADLA